MIRILILVILSTTALFSQNLERFTFSECLKECSNDSSKIEEIILKGDLTIIKLKTYAPCNGNFAGGVEEKNNFLNLKFWTKSTNLKDKNGNVSELVEVADCNCVFRFTYEVKDLKVRADLVKVNGLTLKQIDTSNILTELSVELDSIK